MITAIEKYKKLRSQNFRLTLTLILMFFMLIVLTSYYTVKPNSQVVKLWFFDVGQGDMEMIQTPDNKRVIIDGGPSESAISEVDKVVPFYDRKIDAVVLTHPHADHLAGLIKLIKTYEVKSLYLTGVSQNTPEYLEFLNLIKEKNIETHVVKTGDYIDLGDGINLDFLFPLTNISETTVENLNNSSIVARLEWGNEAALYMGDLETEGQNELLATGQNVKADLIKVSHHGSSDSADEKFIKAVSPKYAVIEVGVDNKFGHPSQNFINILKNVKIYRTDQDGNIEFDMSQNEMNYKGTSN